MNKQKLISAGIAAIACFGLFVMVLPTYNELMQARTDLTAHQDKLKERTDLIAKVVQLNGQYQQYTDQISKLDIMVPETKQADQIIASLQELTSQSGLILTEVGLSNAPEGGTTSGHRSAIVNLSMTGNYIQFINFIKLAELNLRLYDVRDFNIGQPSGSQKGGLNFQMKIDVNSIK